MKFVNPNVLSAADTADATGSTIDGSQLYACSFQAVFGDATAAGTFKIQMSNDAQPVYYNSTTGFSPTNWTDIPNASASITSGGSAVITLNLVSYRWLRAIYTRTSGGSSTINVMMFATAI